MLASYFSDATHYHPHYVRNLWWHFVSPMRELLLYIQTLVLQSLSLGVPNAPSSSWLGLRTYLGMKTIAITLDLWRSVAPATIVSSVQFSQSVGSDSLWPHVLQHARPPCLAPTPGVYSNSCPLSRWCHPTISFTTVKIVVIMSILPLEVEISTLYTEVRHHWLSKMTVIVSLKLLFLFTEWRCV